MNVQWGNSVQILPVVLCLPWWSKNKLWAIFVAVFGQSKTGYIKYKISETQIKKSNKTAWGIKFPLLEKHCSTAGSECEPGQCEVVRVSHGGGGSYTVESSQLSSHHLHLLLKPSSRSSSSRSCDEYSGEVGGEASQSAVSVSLCEGMVGWHRVTPARPDSLHLAGWSHPHQGRHLLHYSPAGGEQEMWRR